MLTAEAIWAWRFQGADPLFLEYERLQLVVEDRGEG
jgi:hypothetical protein